MLVQPKAPRSPSLADDPAHQRITVKATTQEVKPQEMARRGEKQVGTTGVGRACQRERQSSEYHLLADGGATCPELLEA